MCRLLIELEPHGPILPCDQIRELNADSITPNILVEVVNRGAVGAADIPVSLLSVSAV